MATRFYFPAEGSGAPSVSPAFDAGWEQTAQATRLKLLYKNTLKALTTIANTGTRTVPITTTQDILCNQFVSDPIPPQKINSSCLFSLVVSALESATTANVTLAVVVRIIDINGTTRATLFSTFNTGTEFGTTQSTRIVAATAVAAVTTQLGDRIVVEVGGHAAAPTAATTFTMRQGTSGGSDFALTASLTTSLNSWCEFSENLAIGESSFENFKSISGGNVISNRPIR